ncbi:Leucine Rich repeat-containing domain protein [Trichostrongylus colubriformis]|uniref:Leucine Rich repeat-containing domain protein n=1 Tax=Trichostrongylus colubriformis TaxID=6319 RepID=A0AAN8G684_TRICO
MRNLTRLVISRNRIETIEEGAFEHLPALKYLDISNNPVSTWSPSAFKDMSVTMDDLNLANTGLFSIPRMSHNAIRHFNLSMNKIYDISRSDLAKTSHLHTLDISYNNLLRFEHDAFDDLVNLITLNISGNPITEILGEQLESLYQLETLSMHDLTSLSRLPYPAEFANLANLQHLEVYNLATTAIPYNVTQIIQNLPPLRSLHIEFREPAIDIQLRDIDMTHIRQLTISGANITEISSTALHMLRGYRVQLTIQDTSIQEFPISLLTTLGNVYFLSLSLPNNQIQSINPFENTDQPWVNQHGTILESLDLSGNPLQCDCNMAWVTQWIQASPKNAQDLEQAHCEHEEASKNSLTYVYSTKYFNSSQCYQSNGKTSNSVLRLILILWVMLFVF